MLRIARYLLNTLLYRRRRAAFKQRLNKLTFKQLAIMAALAEELDQQ